MFHGLHETQKRKIVETLKTFTMPWPLSAARLRLDVVHRRWCHARRVVGTALWLITDPPHLEFAGLLVALGAVMRENLSPLEHLVSLRFLVAEVCTMYR